MINKTYILLGGILGLTLLIGGAFFFRSGEKNRENEEKLTPTPTVVFAPLEEELEVSLVKKKGVEEVVLTINNIPEDIEAIEYELSYLTEKGLPRGVLGKIKIAAESEISRDITLGTCSRNVCVYDKNVGRISLALKFTGEKGTRVYQKEFEL